MKYVYFFGAGRTEGTREQKNLLGGKGANLAEMSRLGLPVPPGFTITTEACESFYTAGKTWPEGLEAEVRGKLAELEQATGKRFGDPENPLLVSVRSGAAASMPGMMDTVLNLGINETTLEALARRSGNPRFAWDSYRRFMQMFGDVVMGVPHHDFELALQSVKDARGVRQDTDLDVDDLKKVVALYSELYHRHVGGGFPTDPWIQLKHSIDAVFGSWNNPRAIRYRQLNDIKGLNGTAVNIQAMVFGNMGDESGTGVCFTRDPANGDNVFYGEYLMNAQGEDVVAGIRTPHPISTLGEQNPAIYRQLLDIRSKLEAHYKDMQDIEFTIEDGKLFMLQTRAGKRTIFAALNAAVDMVDEGLIDRDTALMRIPAGSFNQLFAPVLDRKSKEKARLITKGLNASPGGASGRAVFTAEDAEAWAGRGESVILCRLETSPEDIGGMAVAKGILTARGGMTSHAAVVARGMGAPCVAGASSLHVDAGSRTITCGDVVIREGDLLAIDGFSGEVFLGAVDVNPSEIVQVLRGMMSESESRLYRNYKRLVGWADEVRRLGVRTNADTPRDAEMAVLFGAEGIGLCRTEHMFFEGDRIVPFREMILVADEVKRLREQAEADPGNEEIRRKLEAPLATYTHALSVLLPLQRSDFEGIFSVLDGKPCNIRLLDPPLHEFLPQDREGQLEMAKVMGVSVERIAEVVETLHEFNPMLGHRGIRIGLTYPEISDMQVRAIMEAAIDCTDRGIKVLPEIMIPLVGHPAELRISRERAQAVVDAVLVERGKPADYIDYRIGTMIEVPRAAVDAGKVAAHADFFSFGTNDLTQMGCGFSRDDAGKFLGDYVRMGIYDKDPFASIDEEGVGELVRLAVERGRGARPGIKLGVCGEHGGDPSSIRFFHNVGLDYVSCSPYRVPVARLAAAQSVLEKAK
ncbi:MAG TPA: pyruvate, phosphate dikinase [Candidatus Fermentibacter daniensis]|nr:MAG: pyruvate phosphate dikinase [Candidatus Fermentibacter daniensis]MBP7720216.1 pyruvate, phosphate dikinase [Candidatus Fermentibacter sp.]OQC69443.1 MAG: Pyruvate, phosphate dikinase [candidate division Hyd24-12 bacterium ADurb.Bin004]KZD18493.1 MAG: pyruvate phosphate dikinase [Candidatus Fermentibacter daniensis]NLI03396.1 pyruvate, phosphate dikinase [Candidatus Fermentibacter daniensis]